MDSVRNLVEHRSFLWLFCVMGAGNLLLLVLSPPTSLNEQRYFVVFFFEFLVLFLIQATSGWALDAWWRASIGRSARPYSYWWRTIACGVGAAGSAFRIFLPAS
jgi:hypothetical protein